MTKTILTFGFSLATILCIYMVYTVGQMYDNPAFNGNMFLGYLKQFLLFSVVFFGVWYFRNKENNGSVTFLKALKIGSLTAFLACSIYVIFGLFYYYIIVPDFIDVYTALMLKSVPADQLAAKTVEMENFKQMFKNPLFATFITYMEVLPTGLVVALLSAVILRKKAEILEQ